MRQLKDDRGQAVILVALCLTCILGFVGFATDVGILLHQKRTLQAAADAAAIAGAKEIQLSTTSSKIQAAGQAAASQNGYVNGTGGATVTINATPVYGPNAGKANYVEAIVRQSQPTFFLRVLGINTSNVTARAVAFYGATNGVACVLALNPTASSTVDLQGSFNMNVPGCSVIDDSNDPGSAMQFTGNGGTLTAGSVGVVGGVSGHSGVSTPAPVTGIAPYSDPLAPTITPPTYTPASCTAAPTGTTWGPAVAGGTVCYNDPSLSVKQNVTMNPGTYVFTGTLDFGGHGTLTGNGVTLYLPVGSSLGGGGNGNTTLNLTAPTSGTYAGILIYEDAANNNPISFNGTPVANLTGIIYAPGAELDLSGNTNMTLTTDLIVNSFYFKGNATITLIDYTKTHTSPLRTVALVE